MRLVIKIVLINFLALGFCINIGLAASYYVDSKYGKDSNTGKSHQQAWKTLYKVNSSVTGIGDDVYLRCGGIWSNQYLYVDWHGTSANRAVIGAYYYDGSEKVGVNNDGKPEIRGIIDLAKTSNNYPTINSNPSLLYATKGYITFQDLHLKNSGDAAVQISKDADHYQVKRLRIENAYGNGIYGSTADYGVIEYNHLTDVNQRVLVKDLPWGGAIEFRHSRGVICRNNFINGGGGEGIGVGNYSTIKNNVIMNFNSVGVYFDGATESEAAYNLVVGTTNLKYDYNNTGWSGRAFDVNIENVSNNTHNTVNNRIHHNIAINCFNGFRFSVSHPKYYPDYVYVYNNQWIDCRFSLRIDNNGTLTANRRVYYKNNISYSKHSGANHFIYNKGNNGWDLSKWDCDYNVWAINSPPTHGDISGSHDKTTDPAFPKKTWRGTIKTIKDFSTSDLIPSAAGIMAGVGLGDRYKQFIKSGSNFNILSPDPKYGNPIKVILTAATGSTVWPMGAFKNASSNGCIVCPPKLLSPN